MFEDMVSGIKTKTKFVCNNQIYLNATLANEMRGLIIHYLGEVDGMKTCIKMNCARSHTDVAFLNNYTACYAIICQEKCKVNMAVKDSKYPTQLAIIKKTVQAARFCVAGSKDQRQCELWQTAYPNITCVNAASAKECYEKINNTEADIGIFDGGEIYDAGKAYGLVVISYEHRASAPSNYTNYYAVAVVRSDSNLTLGTLKGSKSCHTGYGKTSGWKIPIGYLLSKDMSWVNCNQAASAAAYFSQSCVPGVSGNKDKLCALCNGTSSTKCTAKDPYAGYTGAFNCLKNGAGDVAFIKASIVSQISGYKLLCLDNTTKETTNFKDCNLAKAPAHAILARKDDVNIPTYIKILKESNNNFGDTSTGFKLFNGSGIFSNSTEIKEVPKNDRPYDKYLDSNYIKDVLKLENCTAELSSTPTPSTTPAPSASNTTSPASRVAPASAGIYSGTPVMVITSVFMVSLAKLMI